MELTQYECYEIKQIAEETLELSYTDLINLYKFIKELSGENKNIDERFQLLKNLIPICCLRGVDYFITAVTKLILHTKLQIDDQIQSRDDN